jgi:hypothetical protein
VLPAPCGMGRFLPTQCLALTLMGATTPRFPTRGQQRRDGDRKPGSRNRHGIARRGGLDPDRPHTRYTARFPGSGGRVVMQRTANPRMAVRFRPGPPFFYNSGRQWRFLRWRHQCFGNRPAHPKAKWRSCDRSTTCHEFTEIPEIQDSARRHEPRQQRRELRSSTATFASPAAFHSRGSPGTSSLLLLPKTVRRTRWRYRFSMTLHIPPRGRYRSQSSDDATANQSGSWSANPAEIAPCRFPENRRGQFRSLRGRAPVRNVAPSP